MNIINGQDVFGAQTLTTNFPMKVIDIDFFSPPQSITLGQEEDHYSTLLHLNINEQSLSGEDDDSLIIYIVIKQDNGNILQYPIYAPEGVLNVTNYGIKISKTEYYFPVVSTMTDHPHNGTIQFRIHAAAMVTDDPEDREGALIAASSKIKYRVDDSIAFNASVPSKFYDRFLEPSSGIVTPEMFQRSDAPFYTDDVLINMALRSNAKIILMIGDYVLNSPIVISGPIYQPKTIFHKGSISYTGEAIYNKYMRHSTTVTVNDVPKSTKNNSKYVECTMPEGMEVYSICSSFPQAIDEVYEKNSENQQYNYHVSTLSEKIFDGMELKISTNIGDIYPVTKAAIVITNIGSPCKFTFDKIESDGDGIEFLSCTLKDMTETEKYNASSVQYVNLYFGSISARYGEKINSGRQVFGSGNESNIVGGKGIYFHLCNVTESQCIDGVRYDAEAEDAGTIKGWLNEIRIFDGRLNSGAYGVYADGIDNSWNKINNIKLQNVAFEPNKLDSKIAANKGINDPWVDYSSYLNRTQKEWIVKTIFKRDLEGNSIESVPNLLPQDQRLVRNLTDFSKTVDIKDFFTVSLGNNKYRYVYQQDISYRKLYKGMYIANGCHRWSFSGLRYAEKPTTPLLIFSTDDPTKVRPYTRRVTYREDGVPSLVGDLTRDSNKPYFYNNSLYRTTSGWLLQTEGNIREFLFEGAQYTADSNFSFSNATSGTLIIPKAQNEVIEEESGEDGVTGTYRTAHVFASFRTVTDGVISPLQEAEIPYVEEIVHNMNALAVDTIMDAGGNTWETLTKNISTYRAFRYDAANNNIVADPDLDSSNKDPDLKRYLRPRLVRGDSYGTYKYYYSFFGNTEIYDGLYKIDLELKDYTPNNWDSTSSYNLKAIVKYDDKIWMPREEIADDKIGVEPGVLYPLEPQEGEEQRYLWREVKVKNTYYFCKTDNGIKILPSRTYITHPSDSTNKIQEIEFGELEENDLFYYSPVLYTIKHDHIPGECDAVKTSNSDNICMTIYGLVDNNYTKNDVLDPYDDSDHTYPLKDGDGTNLPDNVRISITVRKLSYQSFEHDIFNIEEKMSEIEEDITEIEGDITDIEENISDIDFQEEIHFSASDDKRPYNYITVSNGIIFPRLLRGSTYSSSNKPYQYIYSEQNIIDKFKDGAYYIKLTNSNTINSYYFIKVGSYIRICPKIGNETISNDTPILINAKEDYILGEASISQAIGDNLGITTQKIYNDLQQGNAPSDNTGRVQILVEVKKLSYEDSKKIISQFLCGLEDRIDNLDARIYALEHPNS